MANTNTDQNPNVPGIENMNVERDLINERALSKDASTYELEKFEYNELYIFNQMDVIGLKKRIGTDKDVDTLTDTFSGRNFNVIPRNDFTKKEILAELKSISKKNFTDYGCVAIAVLTHGSDHGLLMAKDEPYDEKEIINHLLLNGSLVTKPKIIIIQACRGEKKTPSTPVYNNDDIYKDTVEDKASYTLPGESDLLILRSSYDGCPSFRNKLYGAWFIQDLCTKIKSYATTQDLESILVHVKRDVSINKEYIEYNTQTQKIEITKQMPIVSTTLIRKLFLRRFGELPGPEESSSDHREDQNINTQLSTPCGSYICFLKYFVYLKKCLSHHIDDNQNDKSARNLLRIAEALGQGEEFIQSKMETSIAISDHLKENFARNVESKKYFYTYDF